MVEVERPVKTVRLQVKSANLDDVGKSFARISEDNMKELGMNPGDLAELVGNDEQTTVVVVWAAAPEDAGKEIIRIDGTVRSNANTSLDEFVQVRKTELVTAEEIEIAPVGRFTLRGAEDYFKRELKGLPISADDKLRIRAGNRLVEYVVTKISPDPESGSVLVNEDTLIRLSVKKGRKDKDEDQLIPKVAYEDIGGLQDTIDMIREMVELPFRFPELFIRLGVSPPKGLLMYGPPGTGKTMLAKAVANESKSNFIFFSGADVFSKFSGEAEKRIREIFDEAKKKAPTIIFIDEIDVFAPRREDASEVTTSLVAQLLALMDGIESRGEVIVIGATNRPNAIDEALRRPGRFDREIEIGVPDRTARREILLIHSRQMPLAKNVSRHKLAEMTHGFVGADLASLTREAAFRSIHRYIPKIDWDTKDVPVQLDQIKVTMEDFTGALALIKPSAMREIFVELPTITWDQVGGLASAKTSLREVVEWPILYPELFRYAKVQPPKGVLLFGSPGNGKTHLVRALANETRFNLISVKGSELLSKWVGESEKRVREMFRRAKQVSPAIVFFDELDALTPARQLESMTEGTSDRVVSAILAEVDGLEELYSGVFVIAATNRPDRLDSALIRPGRFDRLLYLPPPDYASKLEILRIYSDGMPLAPDIILEELAEMLPTATGATLELWCKEAAMLAVRRFMTTEVTNRFGSFTSISRGALRTLLQQQPFKVTQEDFLKALETLPKGTDESKMVSYRFAKEKGLLS